MNEEDKKQLLQKLLAKKKQVSEAPVNDRITASHQTKFALSEVQRGIWMDCLIDPDSAVYNIPFACKIKGNVDIEAMRTGIRKIMERHEIWRTVIVKEGDEVCQKVLPEVDLDFRFFDRRGANYIDEMVAEEGKTFVAEPIDMANGPLVRFALYQTEDTCFYFVLSGHHIVYDGTSENLFCQELSAEYSAALHHQKSSVEEPEISYGDYAEFSLSKAGSKAVQAQIEYWKQELTGIEPTEFPTDCVRPAVRKSEGGMIYFDIPCEIEAQIRKYALSRNVTVNVVMFAALNSLLQLYTREENISVEITVADRDNEQYEKLLGCFINNLIIVTQVNPEMTFDEVIAATKDRIFRAYGNKDVPLEKLVENINPPRDLSRTPFSEVGFNYNPRKRMELTLEDCECEEFGLGDFVVLTDVNFQIHDDETSLCGFLEYNRSIYTRPTIESILARYMVMLEKLTASPEKKIAQIEAVTEAEKQQILVDFRGQHVDYPQDRTIVAQIEETAARTPERIAVIFEDRKMTYGEFNEKANQLAHRLIDLGVKADDLVGIVAERSIEMILGIVGILKSGGAYLPMDPAYPESRIDYILSDASPKAVLTYQATVKTDLPIIDLADQTVYTGMSSDPKTSTQPENLAYCIYTSGTTGDSKGVLIEHRNLIAYVTQFIKYYGINEDSVMLQQAYVGFDTSIEELFPVLVCGGKMVVVDKEHLLNADRMQQTILREKINIISCSPLLVKEMDYLADSELVTLISGGDVLKKEYFDSIKNTDIRVYNTYGPTESTVCATYYPINFADANENIPIGKPIGNCQIYIQNGDTLCGIGVPGELCVAGTGVTRGYLNRPELTQAKYVANPYGEGRIYRTGDLARWLPDGNIEYLGRIDEQVKIRGFRVELGEVESHIRQMAQVKDCAVIARTDASGEKAIYAYYISDVQLSAVEVRDHLLRLLPEYMIPAYMMQIESIPVTRNGKLDKRALPDIDVRTGNEYVAPKNETEAIICRIFSEVLNVEQVSINDSFFALGGHSLRATRLVNQIESETGKRLALKDVFSCPTPEQLAKIVCDENRKEFESIPHAEDKEYYPMSSAQKRTYLVCQLDPKGVLYNMPESYRLEGEVRPDALRAALQKIIDRHEILRTQFLMVDGEPMQKILEHVEADFEYFADHDSDEAELIEAFTRPFDLHTVPLVRVRLIDRGDHSLLSIDMHHIVGDGMSAGTFTKELNALYNGETLPPLTHQFKDYSEWMRSRDLQGQAAYWKSQFEEEIPVLDMPLDYVRPQEQHHEGAMLTMPTGKRIGEKMKKLAASTGTTEFMVLLSAAMILLGKYSRQEDVVIGTPISGRTHKDTENMLGMFVNTLAMRGRPEGNKTFVAFLDEVKETCLKAYENQDYPFEELVEAVDVQRDLSRNPLFDVMLVLQNNEEEALHLGEAKAVLAETKDTIAKIDLSFDIYEDDGDFVVGLEFCTALFSRESAQKFLEHYIVLLDKLTDAPKEKIANVEVVSDEEKKLVLEDFNDTDAAYPSEKTFVEIFEGQVAKTPNHVAVFFEGETLTYQELNDRANCLAHLLRTKYQVQPNDFVAMLTSRSLEMIISIFGIIKAGGAYVPMDPTYPTERIAFMLEDASPKAVLTFDASLQTTLPVIDLSDPQIFADPVEELPGVNQPTDLMYCIYTSGTTGKPKGVMIEHRNVCNLATYMRTELKISEKDHSLLFANYIFDGSVFEMLLALMNGAALYIPTDETIRDIDAMKKYVASHQINISYFPPQYYEQGRFALDKYVVTAGSAASMSVVRTILENCGYINSYGPTEATVCISNWICEKGMEPERITIGKPISNAKVYIVQGDVLCGVGVPGELCVAGAGIARGYLNRPELTQEKFVENPFGEGRMYHTGDLARWLPDGNIEYLGRIDEQVKIRGYRIELGEIDSKLREMETIKDCAVIARNDANGEKAIYAYYVSEKKVEGASVRDALSKSLPDYMIPSYMMQIEQIPMTRNGKLDKRALPDIEVRTGSEYVAPRNETEKIICQIFSEILNVEQVSIKGSFFALSGHSLRATRLINRIEAETGRRIPLKSVFSSPTPEKLAEIVDGKDDIEFATIPHAEKKEYYPMSSAQKRTYLICQLTPDGILYNMPEFLKLTGEVRPDAMKDALQQLIDRHEILRTQFLMIDGEPMQKILDHAEADFEYIRDTETDEAELIRKFTRPFDLSRVPLVRVQLIDRGDCHLLNIDMHHIVGDGMSVGTFTREFNALYNGEKLEPLTHQFKDYSEWMRTRDLSGQARYWKSQFADEIPVLDMPLDFPRPQEQSYSGAMAFRYTGQELGEKIKQLSASTGTTAFMVLMSAAMVLLAKYSRQEDIVIGTPISGRTHKDTEGMLGMFINTLAMRGRPEGRKSCQDFLLEVKDTCLKAYENQEYPFEELVEAVDVMRDMSRNPLFDVMLILQNNESETIHLQGAETDYAESEDTVSKLDLTFNISESEGDYQIGLEYCTALFTEESAERILQHYVVVLEQLVADPFCRIEDIHLLGEDEQEMILTKFNDTAVDYARTQTIVDRFEEQVAAHPDIIAVKCGEESLTYGQLNQKANQLAGKLRAIGVTPNDFVAIYTQRSLQMIIGMYGVMKAGGAYVPVDPAYPKERIDYMIEDSAPKAVLIYQTDIRTDTAVIDLGDSELYTGNDENLEHVNVPEDVLYCIYTSGTTGKPKGVMVKHQNVVNYSHVSNLSTMAYAYEQHLSRFVSVTNMVFDIFVTEAILTLCNGMTAYLATSEQQNDLEAFEKLVFENQVEILQTTPSRIKGFFAQNPETKVFAGMKYIMLGGEAVGADVVARLKAASDAVIENVYGPSETTVWSSCFQIDREYADIPIGKPISNTQIYIVDKGALCGIGVPGELCIAGDGLARGYLNRPELTAEKFVKNPFGEGRMYHTGDLARWLPDGNIAYLGRIDEQVKVRGYRIELGEIENRIRENEEVKDCAVIARNDAYGDKAVFAYVVGDEEIDLSKIRDALSKSLPEYMIPSYLMQIERIPVTRNGKLDKRALPEIAAKAGKEYVAPRTEMERLIASVFEEMLGVEKVGINDNFFELGGNSLKAIRISSKLKLSNLNVSTKDLHTQKTVAQLAALLGDQTEACLPESEESSDTSDIVVTMLEPQVVEGKKIVNDSVIEAIAKYKQNIADKQVVQSYTPNFMQKYYLKLSSDESSIIGVCLHVSGVGLSELKEALKQMVCDQSALRTCYNDENGNMIEYAYGEWEIPDISASQAQSRESVSSCLFTHEVHTGEDILPIILIAEMERGEFDVYIAANHALWDRSSCDIASDLLEAYLKHSMNTVQNMTYSEFVQHRGTTDQFVHEKDEMSYIHQVIDAYIDRSKDSYENKAFSVTLKRDPNVTCDVNWLMSKFCEISDTQDLHAVPFFMLYHCRDDRSMNTLGYFIDYVPCVFEKTDKKIRFYEETIDKLKEGSAKYRFLCDEYANGICDDVVVVNLKETIDELKKEDINMIELYNMGELPAQEGIECCLDDDTIYVGMGFHMHNVSDEAFMRRIQKAFSI